MSRTATLRKVLGEDWTLQFVPADGDCFFAGVSKALGGEPTTQQLRDDVADACDDDTLDSLRATRAAGLPEYDYIDDCDDLDALRDRLRVPGGKARCIWADDFAIRTIAAIQCVGIAILDESARGAGRFVAIGAGAAQVIVLQRTRRQHYNLVVRRDQTTFAPAAISAHWPAFARDAVADGRCAKRARTEK